MNNMNQIKEIMTSPEHRKRVSIIRTTVIKERSMLYGARQINTPEIAAGLARELYENVDRKMLIVCSIDTKCNPLALEFVAIGTVNTCIVSPREVFKYAILSNAANIIAFHNHPSGDCTPSNEDILITKRLTEAGDLLGISVLDHIIIGDDKAYLSLREHGIISGNPKSQIYMKE